MITKGTGVGIQIAAIVNAYIPLGILIADACLYNLIGKRMPVASGTTHKPHHSLFIYDRPLYQLHLLYRSIHPYGGTRDHQAY